MSGNVAVYDTMDGFPVVAQAEELGEYHRQPTRMIVVVNTKIDLKAYAQSFRSIRSAISQTVPRCSEYTVQHSSESTKAKSLGVSWLMILPIPVSDHG